MLEDTDAQQLVRLYQSYGYEHAEHLSKRPAFLVFVLPYGMYKAADIVRLDVNRAVDDIRKSLADLGYATEIRTYSSISQAEDTLFSGFFTNSSTKTRLRHSYQSFVDRQSRILPPGFKYNFKSPPFSYDHFLIASEVLDKPVEVLESQNLNAAEFVVRSFAQIDGPLLVLLEAAAGSGKTCTIHEIVRHLLDDREDMLPMLTELSRNKEARIFNHVLFSEIIENYSNGVDPKAVISLIQSGRIVLIVDGFDELITRVDSDSAPGAESMLYTILKMLGTKARIIVTSRRTVIADDEKLYEILLSAGASYSLVRMRILEPDVSLWLNAEQLEALQTRGYQINSIANPALLAFLGCLSVGELLEYGESHKSLPDKYLDIMLNRERDRQNLKLRDYEQVHLFKRFARLLCEFNVVSEEKSFMKDLLSEYCRDIIEVSLDRYQPDERPTFDDLVETLSNHVLLDKKHNRMIGLTNDFVAGHLVGRCITDGDFQRHLHGKKLHEVIPLDYFEKSVVAIQSASLQQREAFISQVTNSEFWSTQELRFDIETMVSRSIKSEYCDMQISDRRFIQIEVVPETMFARVSFHNCEFLECTLSLDQFEEVVFTNCRFYRTNVKGSKGVGRVQLFSCDDPDGALSRFDEYRQSTVVNEDYNEELYEQILLAHLKSDKRTPKTRTIALLKETIRDVSESEILRGLERCKREQLLFVNGKATILSKTGLSLAVRLSTRGGK